MTAAAHGAEVGPVETAVHRLAPQCKVAALLAFVVAVALVPYRHAWPYAIDAALLAAVVVASRTPPALLARRLVVEIPFVAFVLVLPFVAQGPQVDVLGVGVARDGLWAAGGIAAKATLAVLAEGSEPLTLFPYTAGDGRLRGALDSGDTVVVYKGGRHLPEVLDAVRDAGRLDDSVYGEQLGLAGEEIARADRRTGSGPYMSTVIVPARRNGHRGEKL